MELNQQFMNKIVMPGQLLNDENKTNDKFLSGHGT